MPPRYQTDPIGSNFRGTPMPPKPNVTSPAEKQKPAIMSNPNLAMWANLNNQVIPMPKAQPPKPQATLPPVTTPAAQPPKPAPKPVSAPPRPPQVPGLQVRPAVQAQRWTDPRPPRQPAYSERPPQGFGGGGYPQLPGGNNQAPPWMQYMNWGPSWGQFGSQFPGPNAGFGGGVGRPMGPQYGMGYFNSQWGSPFQGGRYQQPMYNQMPTLPNTPTSPQFPTYYRPGSMPW